MTTLNINNKEYALDLKGNETLLEVLRDHLGLTGTKSGCDDSQCGACTVLMDGKTVLSCSTLACDAEGSIVTTIEGLAENDTLHPIQKAFIDAGAVQCGFCTPGMIMSSKALLDKNADPSPEEIKEGLDGNLCRCAGYLKIMEAVRLAAQEMKKHA